MDASIIRSGIFEVHMCCTKDCTDEYILRRASEEDGGVWAVKDLGESTRVQCEDDPERMHVVLSYVTSTQGSFA